MGTTPKVKQGRGSRRASKYLLSTSMVFGKCVRLETHGLRFKTRLESVNVSGVKVLRTCLLEDGSQYAISGSLKDLKPKVDTILSNI